MRGYTLPFFACCINIFLGMNFPAGAQASAGSAALFESRTVVDMPTAGILPLSTLGFYSRIAPSGNFTTDFTVVPFTNFTISFTGNALNTISTKPIEFLIPTITLRCRLIDEKRTFPAISLGASSQTNGLFSQDFLLNRSIGVWISISKNFRSPLGATALHGGLLASDHSLSSFVGIEQSVGPTIALLPEIILASTQNSTKLQVFVNLGLRWSVARGVTLELLAHDLTGIATTRIGRSFGVEVIRAW